MPSSPSADSTFLNQLAWRLAAGIAAGAALLAVILTNTKQEANAARVAAPAAQAPSVPVPASAPPASPQAKAQVELPVGGEVERCIKFCASHITRDRCFVVFSHGTCVIVNEPSTQPVIDAIHTLVDTASPEARFITREIEDGHHLVTYRRAAFHCVFAEEISAHRETIEQEFLDYLTPAERRIMAADFDPPFHARLGLVARARLNLDARDPVVVKVVRAKPEEEKADSYVPFGPPEFEGPDHPADPLHPPRIIPPFLPGV